MSRTLGILLAAGKGSRMKSDLPKVLHTVDGVPMARRALEAMWQAGADEVVLVVGYRQDLVRAEFGDEVKYAEQLEQLGTGHATLAARSFLEAHDGKVLVGYGDAPLMSSTTMRRLLEALDEPGVACSLLSLMTNTPPKAGRIVRDADGRFQRIVEDQDCTPEQARIREVNVGQYAFDSRALLTSLEALRPNNAQGEYYLTDVPEALVGMGHHVEVVGTTNVLETLGVNDRHHLAFAEKVKHIEYAEQLYPLLDATLEMQRSLQEDAG